MNALLTHCGSTQVAEAEIVDIPTPEPTRSWTPIPHAELWNAVRTEVEHSGLIVTNTECAVWGRNEATTDRFFGLMDVQSATTDFAMVVGIRNSHDKSFPAGLCVGSHVFVCDNLAFSSEIVIARKHTRYIRRDLPNLVNRAVGKLGDHRQRQAARIEAYKAMDLRDIEANDLVVRGLDARAICSTQVPKVLKAYREPLHEEFQPRNGWSMFNAFTEVMKGTNPGDMPRRTMALHGVMDLAASVN